MIMWAFPVLVLIADYLRFFALKRQRRLEHRSARSGALGPAIVPGVLNRRRRRERRERRASRRNPVERVSQNDRLERELVTGVLDRLGHPGARPVSRRLVSNLRPPAVLRPAGRIVLLVRPGVTAVRRLLQHRSGTVPRTCDTRSSETVDRYDQRSGHTEYRNNHASGHKADHLTTALMWCERSIEHIGKLAVPQESVNRESGTQEREATPENDVQVPKCRVGFAQ
jgi:hypothetical protein